MSDTRSRLLAATNELFRRQGYNGTAITEVTTAAEATTGSLYHFFPGGKAELARAVVSESGQAYQQLFEAIADGAGGPAEGVGAFFDGAAAVLAATDYIDVCPIGTVAREVANTDEALRATCAQVFESWTESLTGRLVAAGLPVAEARALATTVIAALKGGFVLARTARDDELLHTIGSRMQHLVATAVESADKTPATTADAPAP